jgi:hypothetical protein
MSPAKDRLHSLPSVGIHLVILMDTNSIINGVPYAGILDMSAYNPVKINFRIKRIILLIIEKLFISFNVSKGPLKVVPQSFLRAPKDVVILIKRVDPH